MEERGYFDCCCLPVGLALFCEYTCMIDGNELLVFRNCDLSRSPFSSMICDRYAFQCHHFAT